jgi:hypothetical protein
MGEVREIGLDPLAIIERQMRRMVETGAARFVTLTATTESGKQFDLVAKKAGETSVVLERIPVGNLPKAAR